MASHSCPSVESINSPDSTPNLSFSKTVSSLKPVSSKYLNKSFGYTISINWRSKLFYLVVILCTFSYSKAHTFFSYPKHRVFPLSLFYNLWKGYEWCVLDGLSGDVMFYYDRGSRAAGVARELLGRLSPLIQYLLSSIEVTKNQWYMQLFERLCATFLHTMPHLFPTTVSIVVKMSSPHCRMQKERGILMRLPWFFNAYLIFKLRYKYSFCKIFTIANCWYSQRGRQEVDYQL